MDLRMGFPIRGSEEIASARRRSLHRLGLEERFGGKMFGSPRSQMRELRHPANGLKLPHCDTMGSVPLHGFPAQSIDSASVILQEAEGFRV
jgi:hypothetical protein